MDFHFTPQEESFREEVRRFVAEEPPETFPCEIEDEGWGMGGWSRAYTRCMAARGLLGIPWPEQYGGRGLSLMHQFILLMELARRKAPTYAHFFNDAVGLSILKHGTEELRRWFLPRMVRGEFSFCTPLSEPGAGSDLLGIQTKAVEDGADFVISGQKVWSSGGFVADWGMVLARTNPQAPKHKGVSTLLVDLNSPGITRRPLVSITGWPSFSEIFFDEVRVPQRNLLGERDGGLPQLLESLEGDRFWGRCTTAARGKQTLEEWIEYARQGRALAQAPWVRHRLAEMAIELEVCLLLSYRAIWLLDKGVALTHEASVLKTFADEMAQRQTQMGMQLLGLYGMLMGEKSPWVPLKGQPVYEYLFSPGFTLAGGTSEIQRNTIAIRGLGLPRG